MILRRAGAKALVATVVTLLGGAGAWYSAPSVMQLVAPPSNVNVGAPFNGVAVTNASTLSFDQADLTDVAGFSVQIDGGSFVDLFVPGQPPSTGTGWNQTALMGGGITFTFPVSALSLSNGLHTLAIYSYNISGTRSASATSIQVTKT